MHKIDLRYDDRFDGEIRTLEACIQNSTREWKRWLGTPERSAIGWQAYPEGPSIGAVMLHMIDSEAYWLETFIAGRTRPRGELGRLLVAETKVMTGKWPIPPDEDWSWFLALHDEVRSRSLAALPGHAPDLVRERKDWSATVRWALAHIAAHDSYHGGQLVILHEQYRRTKTPLRP